MKLTDNTKQTILNKFLKMGESNPVTFADKWILNFVSMTNKERATHYMKEVYCSLYHLYLSYPNVVSKMGVMKKIAVKLDNMFPNDEYLLGVTDKGDARSYVDVYRNIFENPKFSNMVSSQKIKKCKKVVDSYVDVPLLGWRKYNPLTETLMDISGFNYSIVSPTSTKDRGISLSVIYAKEASRFGWFNEDYFKSLINKDKIDVFYDLIEKANDDDFIKTMYVFAAAYYGKTFRVADSDKIAEVIDNIDKGLDFGLSNLLKEMFLLFCSQALLDFKLIKLGEEILKSRSDIEFLVFNLFSNTEDIILDDKVFDRNIFEHEHTTCKLMMNENLNHVSNIDLSEYGKIGLPTHAYEQGYFASLSLFYARLQLNSFNERIDALNEII